MTIIDAENTIYHYTSLSVFMNHILPTKQLKLAKIKNSRDPYEYKAFQYLSYDGDALGEDEGFLEFLESARNLKLNSQYLCFTLSESHSGNNLRYFTRWGYGRPKLWELYGDKHRGVCIGFDKQKIISNFENQSYGKHIGEIDHRRVQYNDIVSRSEPLKDRPLSEFFRVFKRFSHDRFVKEFKVPFFFQKDSDYEDENEYRFLLITNKDQEDVKFSVRDSITSLHFGDLVSTDFLNFYYSIIKNEFPDLKFEQVHWFNGMVKSRVFDGD